MAIFHLTTKPLSRSSGRSAVAAAAYRSGTVLTDMRQGLTHDYERRFGVEHKELVLPEGADAVYWTRQQLWNAAEFAEARKDGRTAREWQLALPEELAAEGRQALAVRFARELAGRYGCAVDVAVHKPDKEGDQRNHHAHLLATTRVLAGEGLGDKTPIELSDAKRLSLGLGQGRQEIEQIRALWAERANEALEKKGRGERIDHRSLVAQQEAALTAGDVIRAAVLDRMPEIKMGWKATAMERRRGEPVQTERGDQLRAIKQENAQRKTWIEQIASLKEKVRQIAARAARLLAFNRVQELEAKKAEGERQRRAEQAANQKQEKERLEQQHRKEIDRRAGKLWGQSSTGKQERIALQQRDQDRQLNVEYLQAIGSEEAALAQRKQENRWKRFVMQPTQEELQRAKAVYQQHREHMMEAEQQLEKLAGQRVAAWPRLQRQAQEQIQNELLRPIGRGEEIGLAVTDQQATALLQWKFPREQERREVFSAMLEDGAEEAFFEERIMVLYDRERKSFMATLDREDRGLLDNKLKELVKPVVSRHRVQSRERGKDYERD